MHKCHAKEPDHQAKALHELSKVNIKATTFITDVQYNSGSKQCVSFYIKPPTTKEWQNIDKYLNNTAQHKHSDNILNSQNAVWARSRVAVVEVNSSMMHGQLKSE